MWWRFTFEDLRIIAHYLGILVVFSAIVYVPSIVVGLLFAEWEAVGRYLIGAGFTLVVGNALRFAYISPRQLGRRQALVVTGLAWMVLALCGSIPLFLSGHYLGYTDALFDGVSGFTTTGASLIQDLDHLSNADNMFRFMMILVGGLGLVVVALSLGLFGRGGAASMYNSEGRSEHVVPNVAQTARLISRLALGFVGVGTVVLAIACMVAGMEPVRAVLHGLWMSITSFMTGGFAPTSNSAGYYHSLPMEILLLLLMLFGSINFVMHDEIWKGHLHTFLEDLETKTMVLWVAAMTFVFAASLCASTEFSSLPAMLRRGLFMVVSAFTTTGLQNITTNQLVGTFSSGAVLSIMLLMAVGASSGGTAGGLKLYRVGIVFKSVAATVKEALAPDSARVTITYYHTGRRILSHATSREALTVFVLFVVTYGIGSLVGVAYGYEATSAIFESVAMTSNGGLSTGIVSAGMPALLKATYILQMWAGRLEFVTLLSLIVGLFVSIRPTSWRRS